MKQRKLFFNLCYIVLLAMVFAKIADINIAYPLAVLLVTGAVVHIVKMQNKGIAFEALAPEVWLPDVKEDFYPAASFLNAAQDMSSLVNYDKINFAEAGADPNVMKNNTVYPIPANVAGDSPKSIELDYYDTDSTIVRNAIAIELAYDQRLLYANKHKKALLKKIGKDAAFAYAPSEADSAKNNFVLNLGANDSIIDGIIDLQKNYNLCDEDGTVRNLVLSPHHLAKISKEDKVLYKNMMAEPGTIFYSFRIWNYTQNPIYVAATGVKAAQGAAFISGTHKYASFAFLGNEVMKAQGTMEMFSTLKDPDIKGDKFNFQMRALVASLRGKYQGAILQ